MSVITTFDEKRAKAREALNEAIKNLQECTKEDTWGYNDIDPEYVDELVDMVAQLIKMKRKL